MKPLRTAVIGISIAAIAALAIVRAAADAGDASASATPAPAATPVLVTINNFAFAPDPVDIPVGGSVTWKNLDTAAHTATDSAGAFDSGNLDQGSSYSFTFTKAGTYHYVCSYHPFMKGTIVVGGTSSSSNGGHGNSRRSR
jgi:plastocyanin